MGENMIITKCTTVKAPSHFRTQSDGLISCCGKPVERTSEIKGYAISQGRSTDFP